MLIDTAYLCAGNYHFHTMKKYLSFCTWLLVAILFTLLIPFSACKHEPILPDDMPQDTIDTDTLVINNPCDPDSVYFEKDILPLLLSNCAFTGCHNTATDDNEEVVLTSYSKVVNSADVKAYDLNDSELYEVITENDNDKIMPPPPYAPLSNEQIALIAKWIQQGAKNNSCDDTLTSGCATDNITYGAIVRPILQGHCTGCHSGTSPSSGIALSTYNQVALIALDGSLNAVITHAAGFIPMPFNQPALSACKIAQIQAWIAAGAPNN